MGKLKKHINTAKWYQVAWGTRTWYWKLTTAQPIAPVGPPGPTKAADSLPAPDPHFNIIRSGSARMPDSMLPNSAFLRNPPNLISFS